MLSRFNIDLQRDLLVPDFACYQMDLNGPVKAAIAAGEVDEQNWLLPSWSKFGANPLRSKGFFTRVLQSLFLGQGGHDDLNVDEILENYAPAGPKVAMMFFSANNMSLQKIGEIAQQTLPAFEIVVLCGASTHNGRQIKNRNAEPIVKEIISLGRPVLIIANQMAQRSFSIPEMTELYLCYDRGEHGATVQKMSRVLTPNNLNKVGNIFSLSFDPNRDDRFDAMIVESALNQKRATQSRSIVDSMRDVLRSVDIFRCTPDGKVKLDTDNYLAGLLARQSVSRVLGKIVNLSKLSQSALVTLASGNKDYTRNAKQSAALHGKTKAPKPKVGGKQGKQQADLQAMARQVIAALLENLELVFYGTDSRILADALDKIAADTELQQDIVAEFGIDFAMLKYLFNQGVIKQEYVEIMLDTLETPVDSI